MKKNKGFTLSEVLITILIIGIIAAITVPVIQTKYTERERISKIKKVYSTIANAMTYVKTDGGNDELFLDHYSDMKLMKGWFDNYLKPRLITTNICYWEEGCWIKDGVYMMNGNKWNFWSNDGRGLGTYTITAVLNDGTLINIDDLTPGQMKAYFHIDTVYPTMTLFFDINGERKPNTLGKDIFVLLYTYEYGLIPPYYKAPVEDIIKDCSNEGIGMSCIQKYLTE